MAKYDSTVLNIKNTAYTSAISQLQSKLRELENARDEYDQQRRAIPEFWSGDAADSAYETIGISIEQVKKAYKTVEENIQTLQEAQQDAASIDSDARQKLEDAKKAVQDLF